MLEQKNPSKRENVCHLLLQLLNGRVLYYTDIKGICNYRNSTIIYTDYIKLYTQISYDKNTYLANKLIIMYLHQPRHYLFDLNLIVFLFINLKYFRWTILYIYN